ncbi:TPA: hypothetical protein LC381_004735 [Salmonella enterica subsp. enterica serovar Wyldegreen]|nr:hypothetical protein [Salmonella enterica subsp. enterica]HBJ6904387.1 hypothetical protein [Salmonella enterica subsp. enterica serovar Wyldegreen]
MNYTFLGNKRCLIVDEFHQPKTHIVYSVDSGVNTVCYTKVGHAATTNNTDDILITINPSTAVTGQLLICKKPL